ncbi:hypothetical protein, partial [Aeromonas veronii]|uniref:hypothetical protein n=1 Tax=Aeromonas veronii TaxID=654 RepID=UPI001E2FA1EE
LTQLVDRQIMSAEELRQAVKRDDTLGLSMLPDEMPEMPDEQDDFKTDEPQQNLFSGRSSSQPEELDNGEEGKTL